MREAGRLKLEIEKRDFVCQRECQDDQAQFHHMEVFIDRLQGQLQLSLIREMEDEEHIDSLQKQIDDMALEIVASSANNQSPKTRDIVHPLPFHDLVLRKEQVRGMQMASIDALEAPFDPSEASTAVHLRAVQKIKEEASNERSNYRFNVKQPSVEWYYRRIFSTDIQQDKDFNQIF